MKTTKAKKSPPNIGEKLQSTIVEACGVQKQVEELTAKLEALKSTIREDALSLMGETQGSLTIDTGLGKCRISRVKDQLTCAPGVDADVLKRLLPKDMWDRFFVMKPALRSTAMDAFLALSKEQRTTLGEPAPFLLEPRSAQVRLPR